MTEFEVTSAVAPFRSGLLRRSILVGVAACGATVVAVLGVYIAGLAFGVDLLAAYAGPSDEPGMRLGEFALLAIGAIGVAPVVESLIFLAIYRLCEVLRLPAAAYVVVMAATSYLLHGGALLNAGQAAAFAVMAWWYVKLRREASGAFWGIVIAHTTLNSIVTGAIGVLLILSPETSRAG